MTAKQEKLKEEANNKMNDFDCKLNKTSYLKS